MRGLFTSKNTHFGLLLIRLMTGIVFIAHGAQKLFGWFDGIGFEGTVAMMSNLGLNPPTLMAILLIFAEFFGGILLFFGFFTRLASLAIVIDMAVAIAVVHLPNGFFSANGGYEYPLLLLVIAFAFLITGPGCVSLDQLFAKKRSRS